MRDLRRNLKDPLTRNKGVFLPLHVRTAQHVMLIVSQHRHRAPPNMKTETLNVGDIYFFAFYVVISPRTRSKKKPMYEGD